METTPRIHQSNLQEHKILILVFCSIGVMMVKTLVPESEEIKRFPFSDVEISIQSYAYFGCTIVSRMVLFTALLLALPKYRIEFLIFFWCEVATVIDYMLRYNEVLIVFYDYPVTITTLKLIIFGFVIGRTLWSKQS
jgi:hypothetical protein